MKIVISSGHGMYIRGARGSPVPPQLDEVDEARRVVDKVASLWKSMGHTVTTFHDNTSRDQNTNLNTIVNFHNKQGAHDLDVSVHFNAYDHSAKGHETLYVSSNGYNYAAKVAPAVSKVGFVNRGPKKRTDLFFLNNTNQVAILIEVCFCDNTTDSNTYTSKFDSVCQAIAESITGGQVPAPEPEPEPDDDEKRVDITGVAKGDVAITFNGQLVSGDASMPEKVTMTLEAEGDVVVTINGEDFHGPFPVPPDPNPEPGPEPEPSQRPTVRKGDTGPDVVTVQECLAITADGIFGSGTETSVKQYQLAQALDVDGVVGPMTWTSLEEDYNLPPYVPPAMFPALTSAEVNAITSMAISSPIASYSWRDRGRAPPGYIKGIAVAYGLVFRKYFAEESEAIEMAKANTRNDDKDAISWYNSNFASIGMNNDVAGIDTLRHLFVLLMGLGMRESSGKHCEGRDQSASNTDANTCEAGLYQQSWNSNTCSPEIPKLMEEYKPGLNSDPPVCALATFKEGVTCSSSSWQNYGSGTGRDFQQLAKSCPQFCVEVAAVGLRNLRQHWGPINRKEAELRKEADEMFVRVEEILSPPVA